MKCPKCGYLGFDSVERCRNCGYDFSLSPVQRLPELALKAERQSSQTALDEFPLSSMPSTPDQTPVSRSGWDALDFAETVEGGTATPASGAGQATQGEDLPLFEKTGDDEETGDDAPLVAVPSKPRAPLAVRRATAPAAPRRRTIRTQVPMLDLPPARKTATMPAVPTDLPAVPEASATFASEALPAGLVARFAATLVDVGVLACIDLVVVYLTLRICSLTMTDVGLVPKAPLIAFLFVQNGGYLVVFNAAGQTLGKMLAGIRVVRATHEQPLDLSRAALRAVIWIALAMPGGLGFLSAVLRPDHRGLHDRCAGTTVIRVSPA